ncbi:hypothetical protein R0381_001195 [Jeongeupia wiesaeckerbachi]|uniref:hypothetical protein n=1 Tax=Jeongeupia wiesaeckerbachi TaxID=3051218 RepID=UPI003D8064CA
MKYRTLVCVVLVLSLLGCATRTKTAKVKQEPVPAFNELVVSYTPTVYGGGTVKTGKGTGLGGLGGLLGPLGAVAGLLIDAAAEGGVTGQNLPRTEKLDKYIKANVAEWDVNRLQAESVAAQIRQRTALKVRVEAASAIAIAKQAQPDNQAHLALGAVSGYGAKGLTDSFKAVFVTEYALWVGAANQQVFRDKLAIAAPQGEETYMTWDGLMADAAKVPAIATKYLTQQGDQVASRLAVVWDDNVRAAQVQSVATVNVEAAPVATP